MNVIDDLQTWTSDLISTHFAQAIELFCEAKNCKHFMTKNTYYISSIIHSVSAVEACASKIAYQVFEDKTSPYFLPRENRDIPLTRMLTSWFNVQTLEKINLFLSMFKNLTLDKSLESKFRELNSLRNWLVHGFCYDTTYLFKQITEEDLEIIDSEDSVDWKKKFPINKFNSIKEINEVDAYKALTIAFDILKVLSQSFNIVVAIDLERGQKPFNIIGADTQIESLFYESKINN